MAMAALVSNVATMATTTNSVSMSSHFPSTRTMPGYYATTSMAQGY